MHATHAHFVLQIEAAATRQSKLWCIDKHGRVDDFTVYGMGIGICIISGWWTLPPASLPACLCGCPHRRQLVLAPPPSEMVPAGSGSKHRDLPSRKPCMEHSRALRDMACNLGGEREGIAQTRLSRTATVQVSLTRPNNSRTYQ